MLLNPFLAKDYAEGKVPVLDVKARDDLERQFLLEMQRFVRGGLAKRLLYYWADGHTEQLLKGERYELLQATYSICFLGETLFPGPAYYHRFCVYDKENDQTLCKDLDMVVIELSKFNVPVEEVKTPLERWCYFFKHGASLDLDNLPATLDVPVIRKAVEVLMLISQTEIERQRYKERQRAEQDAASLAADVKWAQEEARVARQLGFDEGHEKGFDEGIEKGIEKGEIIGRIRLLQQLLALPELSRQELNRQPEADLVRLEESLKRQLSGKKEANGTPPATPA